MKRMSIQRTSIVASLTAVLSFVSLVALPSVSRAMYFAPSMTQEEELVQFRQAGLHGDRSLIPVMIEALKNPPHSDYLQTSLLSLAQMGATEAMPAIDSVIQDNKDENVVNFAKTARARLVAEDSVKGIKDPQAQSTAEVKRFYQELGVTSAGLNTGVAAYKEMLRQKRASLVITMDADPPIAPVELYAMRELADMTYQSPYRAFATLSDVAAVDFSSDAGSALKIRLSSLAHDQRVTTMLLEMTTPGRDLRQTASAASAEMAKAGVGSLEEAQLLADEGMAVILAVKSQQREIRSHPERYRGHAGGFGYLETVLVGAGDRQGVLGDRPGIALGRTSQSGAKATLEKHVLRQQFVVGY